MSMAIKQNIEAAIERYPGVAAMSGGALEHLRDTEIHYKELAEKVRYDPGMTATILKLVNSAYFGLRQKVETLQRAFAVLGTRRVLHVLLTETALRRMNVRLPGYDLSPQDFVRHSAWVAVAAEHLAAEIGHEAPDLCFTCGLLHDMGKLPLDPFLEERQDLFYERMNDADFESFDELETRELGINHAQAGALLLEQWDLPEPIATVARWHHDPDHCPRQLPVLQIVHLADMLAYAEGVGAGIEGVHYRFSEAAMRSLGVTGTKLEYIASQTLDDMDELSSIVVTAAERGG